MKREKKRKDRGIVDLMMTLTHFFRDLNQWVSEMKTPKMAPIPFIRWQTTSIWGY